MLTEPVKSTLRLSGVALVVWLMALAGDAGSPEKIEVGGRARNTPSGTMIKDLQRSTLALQEIELALRASDKNNPLETGLEKGLRKIDAYRIQTAPKIRGAANEQDSKAVAAEYLRLGFATLYDETEYTRYLVAQHIAQARYALGRLKRLESSSAIIAEEHEKLLKHILLNLFSFGVDLTMPTTSPNGSEELLLAKGFLFGRSWAEAEHVFQATLAAL